MQSRKTSFQKTISWRIIATAITFAVGLAITGSVESATAIAFLESLIKSLAYYYHERLWSKE